jgi:outer membrane putative beta-barrel porin/alpha-amylase
MRRARSNAFKQLTWRCVLLTIVSPSVAPIAGAAGAQEIEPRAYSANPLGVTFAGLSVLHSSGDVVLEPTSPLADVSAKVYTGVLAFGRTFSFFGRTANAGMGLPYAWAKVSGRIDEDARSVERAGLADTRVRFGVNLLGGRAMALPEFVRRKPSTTLGTSLVVSIPTGQYFEDKLVNIGTNRWAFKPEIGVSHPTGPWTLELYGGGWFFTENDSYLGNKRRKQDPMLSLQSHVGYTIQPRLWVAADVTYYVGGRVVTDGVPASDRQDNLRVGLTTSLPVGRSHSVKLAWSRGAITRLGGNFDTWALAWQTTHIRIPARKPAADSR